MVRRITWDSYTRGLWGLIGVKKIVRDSCLLGVHCTLYTVQIILINNNKDFENVGLNRL